MIAEGGHSPQAPLHILRSVTHRAECKARFNCLGGWCVDRAGYRDVGIQNNAKLVLNGLFVPQQMEGNKLTSKSRDCSRSGLSEGTMSDFAQRLIENRAFVSILPSFGGQLVPQLLLSVVFTILLAGSVLADSSITSHTYRFGPNDVVRIQVFGEDDLTVESKVAGDGTISFPLLGAVTLAGKTLQEVQEYLTTRLAEGYVRSPRVTLLMVRHRNFYVSGEEKTPGGYLYESGLTVQKASSMAGGFTERADMAEITVNRLQDGAIRVLTLDVQALLLPNDEIVGPQLRKFFVEGEVRQPGPFQYEKGMTVHMAIAMAGGFTGRAAKKSTEVLRIINGTERIIEVSLDTPILPADIVMVPQRFF